MTGSRSLAAVFLIMLLGSPALSQKTNSKTGSSTTGSQSATTTRSKSDVSLPVSKLTSLVDDINGDQGDYISCEFTVAQLLSYKIPPVAATLSSKDADELREKLLNQIVATSDQWPQEISDFIIKYISQIDFEGRTRSEALAVVLSVLSDAREEQHRKTSALTGAPSLRDTVTMALVQNGMDQSAIDRIKTKIPAGPSSPSSLEIASGALADYIGEETRSLQQYSEYSNFPDTGSKKKSVNAAVIVRQSIQQAISPQNLQQVQQATQAATDSAREAISAFQRPKDVGCASSILSYKETRFAFGQLVADRYIAIQIVVRNLSEQKEFALHDAELAVDTDPSGKRYGRFFSGRDKLIVRGISLAQKDFSRRNLLAHTAEAVGTLMSAVLPIAGSTFSDATSVYNSGFIPGLKATYADHSTEQLNLLNDLGFSSSSTYKTVVPKASSVMFVIFVPSEQFEQGWWTQQCVQMRKLKITASPSTGQLITDSPGRASVGTDVAVALENCDTDPIALARVRYKDWSPISLDLFRELTVAVVAGQHVQEESQTKPSISQIQCPANDQGNIQIAQAAGDSLTCTVLGENLDKITSLRLRSADDTLNPHTLDGTVSISGDTKKGKVVFSTDGFGQLDKPAYRVYMLAKDGTETNSNQVIHVDLAPMSKGIDPALLDLNSASPVSFTIQGYHLDNVEKIHLSDGSAINDDLDTKTKSATKITFDVSTTDPKLAGIKDTTKLEVSYKLKDAATLLSTKLQLECKAKAAAPVAPKPDTTKKKTGAKLPASPAKK